MSWVVVTVDVGDESIILVVPVSMTPVAVAGVVVAFDVDDVVLGVIGSPAAMSPVAVAWVVVASHVDGVRVDLLSIIIVPDTVTVDSVSDDGSRVVHDSGVDDRTVDDDSILLLLRHLILRPGTVSPPAV